MKAASREAQQGPPKRSRALRSSVPGDVLLYPPEVQRVSLVDRQADDFGDFKGVDGSKVRTEEQSRSRPRRRLRAPGPAPRPPRFKAPAAATGEFCFEFGVYRTLPGAWPGAERAPCSGNAGNPVRE